MDLRQIRYFVAVAEERSFTRAAGRLRVSQPPLSQAVKTLEEEIGVQLLLRNRRGVVPTDAGLLFLEKARHVIGALKAAVDDTVQVASGKGGNIRIGAIASSLFRVMPPILAGLRKQLPEVSVTLTETNSHGLLVGLLRDDFDFAILHGPTGAEGVRTELLCTERMCAVLPISHPLAKRRSLAVGALRDEEFVLFDRAQAPTFFDSIISLCVGAGFSPKIRHMCRDSPTMLQMVSLGVGVTIASDSLKLTGAPGISFPLLNDPSATIPCFLAWKKSRPSKLVEQAVAIALGHSS